MSLIVDSHVHIWAPHSSERPWPRPETAKPHSAYPGVAESGMTKHMLLTAMDSAGVDRAILIPPSWEGHYNDLALDAAQDYPDRFAIMGRIFLEQPMSELEFVEWRQQPGILGVRGIFHSPRYQQLLLQGEFDWLWPLAERQQLPVTVMLPGLDNAADFIHQLLAKYPALKLSLDHLNIRGSNKSHVARQVQQFSALAKYENFAVKTSAVPSWSQAHYPFVDTQEHLKRLFDAFGPQRMFWGSDFTRLDVDYRQVVSQFSETLDWLRGSDREWVMGRGICEWLDWPIGNNRSAQN
jgi:L-fuconolactonase